MATPENQTYSAQVTVQSITVEDKQKRDGSGSFRIYHVATSGGTFDTFDRGTAEKLHTAQGQPVTIFYEEGQFGRRIKNVAQPDPLSSSGGQPPQPTPFAGGGAPEPFEPMGSAPPAGTPQRTQPDGSPDWDTIALQKTRCALWAAALGNFQAFADLGSVRQAVLAAEVDIFHRAPSQAEDDIPF